MNEEVTISFKEKTGFIINNETDITTGKIIINNIEITSVEDWKKVVDSLVQLQQENARLKDKNDTIEKWLKYKAEALDTFDIPKRKETGAFWFTTRGEIDGLLELLKEN